MGISPDIDVIPGLNLTGRSYDCGQVRTCRSGRLDGDYTPIPDFDGCEYPARNEQHRKAGNDHLPTFLQTNSPHSD